MIRMTLLTAILALVSMPAGSEGGSGPGLGEPASATLIERWSISVYPDGRGLPDGAGDATTGRRLYQQHCLGCHAAAGAGGSADRLANPERSLTEAYADKTIGNFWPYATTLFDFIRRSKPMNRPGSLDNDEVYALTAYLLHINDLIAADAVIDKTTLPRLVMPNSDGFINHQEDWVSQ